MEWKEKIMNAAKIINSIRLDVNKIKDATEEPNLLEVLLQLAKLD